VLNEQAGIRGFAATGQRAVLEQYDKGRADFDQSSLALIPIIERIGIPGALERIRALQSENLDWIAHLALPTMANRSFYAAHLPKKAIAESFRGEEADLDRSIQRRAFEARTHTRNAVRHLAAITVVICAIVASLIIYASQRQRWLLRVIESEQGIIATLQSALINHLKPVSGIEIGKAYISATDGAAVGGDFFDVQPLDGTRGYILVGDVSGKGVNAAVDTALVRHGIRSLLVVERDPGTVLSNFNEAFIASRSGDEIFVAMFLGIIDTASRELRYASAGHGQAYLHAQDARRSRHPSTPRRVTPGHPERSRGTATNVLVLCAIHVPENDMAGPVQNDFFTGIDACGITGCQRLHAVFAADGKFGTSLGNEQERAPAGCRRMPQLGAGFDFRGAKRRIRVEPDLCIDAGLPRGNRQPAIV
jgi:hypothetical protein